MSSHVFVQVALVAKPSTTLRAANFVGSLVLVKLYGVTNGLMIFELRERDHVTSPLQLVQAQHTVGLTVSSVVTLFKT